MQVIKKYLLYSQATYSKVFSESPPRKHIRNAPEKLNKSCMDNYCARLRVHGTSSGNSRNFRETTPHCSG